MTPGSGAFQPDGILYGATPARIREIVDREQPLGRYGGPIFSPPDPLDPELARSLAHSFDHMLALGMNRLYGFQIRAFGLEPDEYTIGTPWRRHIDRPRHFYCLNYDQRPVDVFGVFEDEPAFYKYWRQYLSGDDVRQITSTDLTEDEIEEIAFDGEFSYAAITEEQMSYAYKALDRLSLDTLRD